MNGKLAFIVRLPDFRAQYLPAIKDFGRVFAVVVAAAATLGLISSKANAADPIKIGVNEPLTGPVAISGNYVINGAKIAADEINGKGGVLEEVDRASYPG